MLALAWRREEKVGTLVTFSWIMSVLVWCMIAANLGVLDVHGALWQFERPVYGIIQRLLFLAWCVWLAGASLILVRNHGLVDARAGAACPRPNSARFRFR